MASLNNNFIMNSWTVYSWLIYKFPMNRAYYRLFMCESAERLGLVSVLDV